MQQFKVGDRVEIINSGVSNYVGKRGIITKIEGNNYYVPEISGTVPWTFFGSTIIEHCFKLIKKEKTMDIKEKFQLAFKQEPEKSFRKLGITNGDDYLTDDGQKIFLSWLLKKNGADFKKEVVDDLLKKDDEE